MRTSRRLIPAVYVAARPFNVASLSKMLTATAVLQLVEAGRLSLETEVASILPGVSTDPRFAQVRVKPAPACGSRTTCG